MVFRFRIIIEGRLLNQVDFRQIIQLKYFTEIYSSVKRSFKYTHTQTHNTTRFSCANNRVFKTEIVGKLLKVVWIYFPSPLF